MALGKNLKLAIGGAALALVAVVGIKSAQRPVGPPIPITVYRTPT